MNEGAQQAGQSSEEHTRVLERIADSILNLSEVRTENPPLSTLGDITTSLACNQDCLGFDTHNCVAPTACE
jgi:hypothetical protein